MRVQFSKFMALLAVAGTAAMLSTTAAQAKYIAIDVAPDLDSNGQPVLDADGYVVTHPVQLDFGGYCDSQNNVGEECDQTYTLPYTVTLGGKDTNQVLLRDDGVLDFVFGPPIDPVDFSDEALTHRFEVLASFDTGIDGGGYPPQLAKFEIQGSSFLATWFLCEKPGPSCGANQHTALFTPGASGFTILSTDLSGGVRTDFLAAKFDPAQVSPVPVSAAPEPTSWALMLLGFGGVGAWARARRRGGLLGAAGA